MAQQIVTAVRTADSAWRELEGRRTLLPSGCGQPVGLLEALRAAPRDLHLELVAGIQSGGYDWLDDGPAGVAFTTWQLTTGLRRSVRGASARYLPMRYSRLVDTFSPGGAYAVDALVVHVTPPDSSGMCSMGVAPSYAATLAQRVPFIVAVINPRMPRTIGHPLFPIDRADVVVEVDSPIVEIPLSGAPSDFDARIAVNVASLIDDGATVQTGIGGVPDALAGALTGRKDLGWAGMLTDSALPLIKSGVVNGRFYAPSPDAIEAGEIMGTKDLYDFADGNEFVRAVSVDHSMRAETFRSIDRFIAVNSAIEVDLTGQVNAESIGSRAISGPGGQLDYMEGALLSPGGKAVIALRSSGKNGASRLVSSLAPGSAVTTPRTAVTHVVTEFGIAELEGRTLAERADSLIAIAAPEHRDRLRAGDR